MKKELIEELCDLSVWAGERWDLVQAGGGNSSVKEGDSMAVKSSGIRLSEVREDYGWSLVDLKAVKSIVKEEAVVSISDKKEREKVSSEKVKAALRSGMRPSIETILHALFKTYTLHVHPLSIVTIASRPSWREDLEKIAPNAVFANYRTPGVDLGIEISQQMEKLKGDDDSGVSVCFLQNHGLIVSSDQVEDIYQEVDRICAAADLEVGFESMHYRRCNKISSIKSELINCRDITFLVEHEEINKYFLSQKEGHVLKPVCPDELVFWGKTCLKCGVFDKDIAKSFIEEQGHFPRVLHTEGQTYISSPTIKKALEIQEVLLMSIRVNQSKGELNYLSSDELDYLGNWEAEKYRQSI